jgi:hypothetical protein
MVCHVHCEQEIKDALGIGASGISIGKYDSLAAARAESTPVRLRCPLHELQ